LWRDRGPRGKSAVGAAAERSAGRGEAAETTGMAPHPSADISHLDCLVIPHPGRSNRRPFVIRLDRFASQRRRHDRLPAYCRLAPG
jgi:hypothetical protein